MDKIIENLDYYFNQQGMMVLTEHYLLKRGYCCGNGCLHCPYQYEKVPEKKKQILLREKPGQENHEHL